MARTLTRRPGGFTIVELLVAISVVAALFAITLPAVQAAREGARRARCANQLRQIALAVVQYHDQHGRYPPGQMFGEYGIGPDSEAWSWCARILPFLEHQALYDKGGIPTSSLRESRIAHTVIPVLLCPSDGRRRGDTSITTGDMADEQFRVGLTNYKAVTGANWGADTSQGLGPGEIGSRWLNKGVNGSYDGLSHGDGIMHREDYLHRRSDGDVIDGLTNTFMIGEAMPYYDAYTSWPYANGGYSTCAIPPNHWGDRGADRSWWPNMQSFRSKHPNGLQFAMAGGAVVWVDESIDIGVYRSRATIAGGEIIDF